MHEGSSPWPILLILCLPLLVFMGLYCASRPHPLSRGKYLDCIDQYIQEAPPALKGSGIIWEAAKAVCQEYKEEDHD